MVRYWASGESSSSLIFLPRIRLPTLDTGEKFPHSLIFTIELAQRFFLNFIFKYTEMLSTIIDFQKLFPIKITTVKNPVKQHNCSKVTTVHCVMKHF